MREADGVGEASDAAGREGVLQLAQDAGAAAGSWKTAVPTATADAPARMNSRASSPVAMPPTPMMGVLGSAACTW